MPEKYEEELEEKTEKIYDYCLIGKTNRDYETVSKASKILKNEGYKGIIVGGKNILKYQSEELICNNRMISYLEAARIYKQSKLNLVILEETNGIYGLTSILDSFTFNIPLIVTKTSGGSVQVYKEGYGLEVSAYSSDKLANAIKKLIKNKRLYYKCKENLKNKQLQFNTHVFSKEICKIIKNSMKEKER